MSVTDALNLAIDIAFILLGLIAILEFLRYGGAIRRDVALLFSLLAIPFIIQLIASLTHEDISDAAQAIAVLGLIVEPYLILRIVRYLQDTPAYMLRLVLYSLLATLVIGIVFEPRIPIISVIASQGYLIGFNLYAMAAFVRGALQTTGVAQRRLRFAAVGSGLFALTFIVALIVNESPEPNIWGALLGQSIALACGVAFYIGFVPPRWLRMIWQLTELRNYLLKSNRKLDRADEGITGRLNQLCHVASQAVDGVAAGVVQWHELWDRWELRESTNPDMMQSAITHGGTLFRQAMRKSSASAIYLSEITDPAKREQLQTVGAGTWLFVPMLVHGRLWGMLVVLLRGQSLFIEDDLNILDLLAQENTLILTNYWLIDELKGYSEQLERKVEERTAELNASEGRYRMLNVQLEQRVKERTLELEATNSELEAFTYSVSHDLRAPLRAIDGFSQALIQKHSDNLPPEALRYLDRVRNNATRMGMLIDDLLTLSRTSRQPLKLIPVPLGNIVQQALDYLQSEREGRQVEIIVSESLPTCEVDSALLTQVYVNLLSNALKYSSQRETAHITVGCDEKEGQRVFFVKDDGVGFDMQYVDKLFGVFQRLHSMEEYPGTGVGLAIVQRIIRRHGGEIWAEGQIGQGATFYFTLKEGEK